MRGGGFRRIFWVGVLGMFVVGCAGHNHQEQVLKPPAAAESAAVGAMEEGNRLHAAHQWQAAKAQYEAAIKIQPALAEAHYNLALTLDMLGEAAVAYRHYMKAADLAPGHKVIWDSPPLRRWGDVESESELDSSDVESGHSH